MKTILHCPRCDQKLRVPTDKGDLTIRCPMCAHSWDWSPKKGEEQAGPFHIDDVEVSEEIYNSYWGITHNALSSTQHKITADNYSEQDTENRLSDLLLRWEELYEQGHDEPAAVLCREWPELIPALEDRIQALKMVAWVNKQRSKISESKHASVHNQVSQPSSFTKADDTPHPGYELITLLGRGGFGEVWSASWSAYGDRLVAMKFIRQAPSDQHHQNQRERIGIQRIENIRHPFILDILGMSFAGNSAILVTELADASLDVQFRELRKWHQPLFLCAYALSLLRDAAEGLDYLQKAHDLMHLDIKPANLLLVNGRCKIGDFGTVTQLWSRPHSKSIELRFPSTEGKDDLVTVRNGTVVHSVVVEYVT